MRYLVISLITVVVFATLSLGWLFDKVYEQYNAEKKQPTTVEMVEELGQDLAKALNEAQSSEAFLSHWPSSSLYGLTLSTFADSALPDELLQMVMQDEVVLLETRNTLLFHYYLKHKNQILILEFPLAKSARQYSTVQYILTLSFYVLLILLFLMWAYPLLRQLSSLRAAAKSFGNGKLDQRVESKSISYIRDIEFEFNNMALRIKNLVDDVKLLSTAVSHDLRTPLARIRFGLDTLEEVEDKAHRATLQQRLGNDVDEMTSLVESLLNYARLDQHRLILKKEAIKLSSIIDECITKKRNDKVQIGFICKAQRACVTADRNYLKMALNNIIQNAINYGHGKVNVVLDTDENSVIISVSDNGTGVPTDLRERIVKPFVRGTERESEYKGHGVGLAIVKRVLDWHNGRLSISDSTDLHGAKFTMTLPKSIQ